jgi:hypothetical protein
MEWLVVLAILVAVVLVVRSGNKRRLEEHAPLLENLDSFSSARKAVDEDITALAEALQALDGEIGGRPLDEGATADYRRSVDAYDSAKQAMASVSGPAELHHVTAIVADGRYAITCVRARVDGDPLPLRRPPCFFNPSHGPSVRDVSWAPDGGVPRDVPACRLDAERVVAGAEPDTRQVLLGTRRVPYYEAGPAFAPFTAGYFGADTTLFAGTVLGMALSGWYGSLGLDAGSGGGHDPGHDSGPQDPGPDGFGIDDS